MSDLERELTSVLAQQAGPTHGDPQAALAEHERRLAARAKTVRNRSIAGVMAVVAAIGVSSALLLNGPSEPSRRVAIPPPSQTEQSGPEGQDMIVLVDYLLDTTPNEPLRYQRSAQLDSDNPAKSDLTVWVTTPEVAEISVVRAGGDTITADSLGLLLHDKVFSVPTLMDDIQRVTMRDENGTVLREDEY